MQVAFVEETWIYRLCKDGTVKKVIKKTICAARKEEEPAKRISRA
jgi:hypothetical protein